ncbi:extracellular solute-binding protein [Candidatus Falkowbacteria bacterium]|nr:extracellular solute-binding protein [Candidatus Falkowbacteria bacterium]
MKPKLTIIILLLAALITSAFSCRCTPPEVTEKIEPLELTWWRAWDSSDDVADIINAYQQLHPHITITYKKLRYEEYENALLNGWARDQGPDIFSLTNTWIRKYQDQISLPPEKTGIPRIIVSGPSFRQTTKIVIQTLNFPTAQDIKKDFVSPVYDDAVVDGQVLALPLAADTMALYYNRDLLDKANIPNPPATWLEFKDAVEKLTLIDNELQIVQSGAGIGTAKNVTRSTDILSLLMLQNNVSLPDIDKPSKTESNYYPGIEALEFYTDFADPNKEIYTWNGGQPNSLDAFISGRSAMFFGYAYHLPTIKARAPKLNFEISPMVQISRNQNVVANTANYWVESVSKKSEHPEEAWDFLLFATTGEVVKDYLEKTKKPTALRSLVNEQKKDPDLSAFTSQLLTAKSWYQGKDFNKVEDIFAEMIDSVVTGQNTSQKAAQTATQKIKQTY